KKNEDNSFEYNFKEIINNLDFVFFRGEYKGKLLFHNIALNKILGIDPSIDLTGTPASQFLSNSKVQQQYYEELEKKGFVKDFIVTMKKPDSSTVYMQINSHLIRDREHGKNIVEGTAIDVTEKFKLEQKLKEEERKFLLISDNTNDLIAILDKNFKHIYINKKAYYNFLGYKEDEVLGKLVRDFIHPEDTRRITNATTVGLFKGEMLEEYRIKHKKGYYIWVESKGSFIKEKQNIVGAIFISRDITDKKESEQRLKESENKYRTLFESSTDGIYSTDVEGKFVEINEAFLNMLGYSREELISMSIRKITPEKWYDIDDEITFTQLSDGENKVYEKEFIRKDGSIIPVGVRLWILHDEQGDPYRIWTIVRDITELKKFEDELIEINRLKSEFLRRASHELKTPLVSIKGFTELILSSYFEELDPKIISNLEEINSGCERLQNIINSLLDASKLETVKFEPKFEKEDLAFLINYCLEELHPLIAQREHSINYEVPDDLITRFEKEEIHDVISNLLTNAIKYTPPKGWIDIKTEIQDGFIIFSIKDNGIGFTEEEKSKIFQQFGKVERYGQGLDLGIDGSGLGLYISKKIIEAHGGQIWMESGGRNKGSTFFFSLPLIKD
ncbi:MAG: PAS domain S-box protein, partial [Promethearchaeota archaeon]